MCVSVMYVSKYVGTLCTHIHVYVCTHVCVFMCVFVYVFAHLVISSRRSEITNLGLGWKKLPSQESDSEDLVLTYVITWYGHLEIRSYSEQTPLCWPSPAWPHPPGYQPTANALPDPQRGLPHTQLLVKLHSAQARRRLSQAEM